MAKGKIYLTVNNREVDTLSDVDFNFRLNRFVQDIKNFQVRGGDYSTELEIPFTKQNGRIFGVTFNNLAINKFNREVEYQFALGINGVELLRGTCLIESLTDKYISISLRGENIDWINKLEQVSLNRLGYVPKVSNPLESEPTWFGVNRLGNVFEGGKTINIVNELNNRQTDYICPTIVRFNTPVTDYLSELEVDIFGLYDSGGNQILAPKDYPDSFKTIRGFFGTRQGLTFEDFPPSIYYRNIIEKCFEEIGYNLDCSLFNEDWFNKLYVPYQGEQYLYNWRTLSELYLGFSGSTTEIHVPPVGFTTPVGTLLKYMGYHFNLAKYDDETQRIDHIANFKKFLVTDEDAAYVVPAKGRYKIRFTSQITKKLTENGSGKPLNEMDRIGSVDPLNYGWDDNMFVIYRKSPDGEYLLNENPPLAALQFMSHIYPNFVNTPCDIVAYVSPKRCITLGNNHPEASGSPLTNFAETVNIINRNHVITNNTILDKSSFSSVTFEIELDLLKNERIDFQCLSFVDLEILPPAFPPVPSSVGKAELIGNNAASEFTVQMICDYEDISIADNLPEISCKEFIKNFANLFQLRFALDNNSKTVRFLRESEFINNDNPYDITNRVNVNSVKYLPSGVARNLTVGYSNDAEDFELNQFVSQCAEDVHVPMNYANKSFTDNPNIYANDTLSILNGFSSTKFIEGDFSGCVDYNTITKSLVTITAPIIGTVFTKGITWGSRFNSAIFRLPVPSIQTITSEGEATVGDLNYNFNQQLRILQYHGTVGEVYNTLSASNEDYRFKIDAPEFLIADYPEWWIRPTISSFDLEAPFYPSYIIPSNTSVPTQSMRYDVSGGLYDKFFSDIVELQNKSHVLQCQAFLTTKDWNNLKANRVVKYNEGLYRLLEISDYDATGTEPCNISMIKLI